MRGEKLLRNDRTNNYTSNHERFIEGNRPSFNVYKQPKSNPRHQRVNSREQPGNLVVGRAIMNMTGLTRQFQSLRC